MQRTSCTLLVVTQYCLGNLRPRHGWKGCVTSTQSSALAATTSCKDDLSAWDIDDSGCFAFGSLQ